MASLKWILVILILLHVSPVKSVLGRVCSSCMLVLHTARSGYQTNAEQVHDFVKTVWPQAYE